MATQRQKKALDKVVENGGIISKAMRDAGYSEETAKTPSKLTDSKGWKELLEEALPDSLLTQKHKELLNSTHLDHMVFPIGPKTNREKNNYITEKVTEAFKAGKTYDGKDVLSDEEIKELLNSVNCVVRKIVHGDSGRHVYFWNKDNKAIKDALDMAFKLKGAYAPVKSDLTTGGEKLPSTDLDALANAMAETLKQQKA